MKNVKCYGRAKVTTVDSSFKRNFFGSNISKNSGNNCFQEIQNGSSSFTSVASTSDCADIHSKLFASNTSDDSYTTFSPFLSKSSKAKHRSVLKTKGVFALKKNYSIDSPPISTYKVNKCRKKSTRSSKKCVKGKTSYSSHIDSVSGCKISRSKNGKYSKAFTKGTFKRYRKTNQCYGLNTHSCIPVQTSSFFLKNHSSAVSTDVKKVQKKKCAKKLQLINGSQDDTSLDSFSTDMIPSFADKNDSFWTAAQPKWSSICAYSLKIEKAPSKGGKLGSVLVEPYVSINTSFLDPIIERNKLLSNKESISGRIHVQNEETNNFKHIAIKKYKSADVSMSKSSFKQGSNLNANSKALDNELKAVSNISEKNSFKEISGVIDTVNDHTHPEMDITDIEHTGEKRDSNLYENVNEYFVKKDKNIFKRKNEGYKESEESNMSKKYFISFVQTAFSTEKTVSGNRDIFNVKDNKCLSEKADQLQEPTSSILIKKSKGFYASTPLTSPSTYTTVKKDSIFARALSPVVQKNIFATSTPTWSSNVTSSKQNEAPNLKKISLSRGLCRSLQDFSIISLGKLQKCPSVEMNSFLLSRRNKNISLVKNSLCSNQNTHHSLSKSCELFSRREQLALEESHCNLFQKAYSPVSNTSAENYIKSTLSKLLEFCGQTSVVPFAELYDWSCTTIRKIGEGTYGEVFTLVQKKISSVIKVIPFKEDNEDYSFQSIETVLSEVTVSQCLSELRNNKNFKTKNFSKLKSVHVVKGCYPDQMLVAWDKYSVAKSTYNSRPDIFNAQQMFAILELEYGGKDMTCFILRNAVEAESVLKQIAISLAIAEETHLFEHRDLHLGNILVQRNASKSISYILGGKNFSIPNYGLVVTIIDFTLSRVLHKDCIFYNDLGDDVSLFDQTGDYQFQIYKDTKLLLNNEWHKCLLYSNVLWLTYWCVKLLDCKYSRPSSKKHEESLNNIETFQKKLRTCQSAFECLTSCNILTSVPKDEPSSAKKMAIKAKLVDRKSLQKSFSRRTSNIA